MDNDTSRQFVTEIDFLSKHLEVLFTENEDWVKIQAMVPIALILIAKILLATYRLHLGVSYE